MFHSARSQSHIERRCMEKENLSESHDFWKKSRSKNFNELFFIPLCEDDYRLEFFIFYSAQLSLYQRQKLGINYSNLKTWIGIKVIHCLINEIMVWVSFDKPSSRIINGSFPSFFSTSSYVCFSFCWFLWFEPRKILRFKNKLTQIGLQSRLASSKMD